jgi:hypothetical protein
MHLRVNISFKTDGMRLREIGRFKTYCLLAGTHHFVID